MIGGYDVTHDSKVTVDIARKCPIDVKFVAGLHAVNRFREDFVHSSIDNHRTVLFLIAEIECAITLYTIEGGMELTVFPAFTIDNLIDV